MFEMIFSEKYAFVSICFSPSISNVNAAKESDIYIHLSIFVVLTGMPSQSL